MKEVFISFYNLISAVIQTIVEMFDNDDNQPPTQMRKYAHY